MSSIRAGGPFSMPPVIKNIIIINIGVFALTFFAQDFMFRYFSLYSLRSPLFEPYQLVTHMFMHGSLGHIFFNMFGVFMFGRILESVWGSKKMLIFYTVCGLGAALTHLTVNYIQMSKLFSLAGQFDAAPSYALFNEIVDKFGIRQVGYYEQMVNFMQQWFYQTDDMSFIPQATTYVQRIVSTNLQVPTVGASGAVFGLLIAFAMMFPDVELIFIFLPVPIKAKYLIPIYAVVELVFGVSNFKWDNVAHFAHLGGALFGFLLVKYWKRNQFRIY
jgi:membrane associated rhomboid family serine protease